ncbi:MAG TPA: SDR family NAD(P)-dependent oxidoreductase [Acidocella sp.]|jgi:NAD(P)-dependent dehydrogenase (short-subunit alcohol dehydrogenase family)|nr:SDR family NAD(P)-dependent oxidoreductase [Acidocella sp.]
MAQQRRTALVTGGGAGMGAATSQRLARDGMAVGVLDINGTNATSVAASITAAGGAALALQADISDRAQVQDVVTRLREKFGPVTVLVNNAAVEDFCAFEKISDQAWDRQLGINLKGPYIVTQTVLPDMLAAGWGRIVNISSFGAQIGAPNMVAYTASKGGIIALTRSLAIELGPKGITVNTVAPGFIDTPMARRAIDSDLFPVPFEQIVATYPIPRLGKAEDVAAACAFFVSEEAGYITAQLLGVNGGAAM